ncbi:MAG TPA: hypothetical protein VNV65_03720 [Candidatus Solibacter sp.]|nr:hypothetical protein [Candidatus Solibacter sp.]
MYRRLIVVFGVSAALAAQALIAGSAPALAYEGCEGETSASASVTAADATVSFNVTVDVRDCTGSGVEGAQVVFGTQSAPQATCQASFNPGQAPTDTNGVASTQASLPAGCPCQYVLGAKVPTSSGGFTVSTTVRENGCLPFTSAAAAQTPPPPLGGVPGPLAGAVLGTVALMVLVAAGVATRRRV